MHMLGVLACQVGKHEVGIDYIGRAIRLNGTEAAFHGNLGEAYRALQRIPEAVACYRRALELKPDFAGAYNGLGIAFKDQGKLDEAIACFRQALELKPDYTEAYNNLGNVLRVHGRLNEAVTCYRRALDLKADYTEAYANLGTVLKDQGKLDEAIACFRRALERIPDFAEAHFNLGNALKEQGKLDEAITSYRRALELKPDLVHGQNNLGVAFNDQGNRAEAITCYRRALELKPDFAEGFNNLGVALKDQGELDEAIACFRRALELIPDFAEAHFNLGNALRDQGNLDEAVECYRRTLELTPDFAHGHNNLGVVFNDQGKLDQAITCYRRALELKPDFAEAHTNLGNAFKDQGNLDEAIACYRRALELTPDNATVHSNLGNAFSDQGKLDEAITCYRRAVELKPDFAEAHLNRALTWLLAGDWQRGWLEYQWRWQTKEFAPRRFSQPLWEGEPLAGKSILLHAEQGLGDTIQFIRYAAVVKQHGGTVIVECQKQLLGLLAGCPGVDRLVGQGDDLPAFDVHAPLLSVPGILKTSLETIPARIPYVIPKPAILEQWRKRLIDIDGFKIGIAWQGNPKYLGDRLRSIPLRCLAPLARIPAVRLISLQKGVGDEQLAEVRDLFPVMDLGNCLQDFTDTCAAIRSLDLVIACDTAVAHLAGAMGAPIWVALPFVPDWRWLLDRSDSPWYPTMRLFRQTQPGDWQSVFQSIAAELAAAVSGRSSLGELPAPDQ